MNSGPVRVFLPVIRRLEGALTVPIPSRVRILRELEDDLEALRARLEAEGVAPPEAVRRALEALAPDAASLSRLADLHTTRYHRSTRRLGSDRLKLLERSALAVATASVLVVETTILVRGDLLRHASPFLWLVVACGSVLFALVGAKVFELWIKGDHRRPERGIGTILWLAGLTLVAGFGGVMVDLIRMAGILERSPELATTLVPVWLVRDCTLLSVSILLAGAGCLGWMVLTQWLSLVSEDRLEFLDLGGHFTSPSRRHHHERALA
ncbi:MAG: hypothetical protein OEZ65_09550 [Gemmatimonadota bacterium]|nr:hypothetical protein [Gemmatimonadota bacterium]